MPGFASLASGLAPTTDAPIPSKADILRSMNKSQPPGKTKFQNRSSFAYTNPADQEAADRRTDIARESRLPIFGPPKLAFLKKIFRRSLKGDGSESAGLREEKGKGKLDEVDQRDYGSQPAETRQEKEVPRISTPPPLSSIPAGPSKSMPPKISGSGTSSDEIPSQSWRGATTVPAVNDSATSVPQHGGWNGGDDRDHEPGGDCGGDNGGGDSGGGCVLGSCLVKMADGTMKPVSDLAKGENVAATPIKDSSWRSSTAEVSCAISFKLPAGKKNMIRVPHSSLVISPTHPILVPTSTSSDTDSSDTPPPAQWIYPSALANPLTIPCDRVYNILLRSSDQAETVTITVGGIQISTLGQGSNYSFSGNYEKVVKELKRIDSDGFEKGSVELGGMRRTNDGRVCGFFGVREITSSVKPGEELHNGQLLAVAA